MVGYGMEDREGGDDKYVCVCVYIYNIHTHTHTHTHTYIYILMADSCCRAETKQHNILKQLYN